MEVLIISFGRKIARLFRSFAIHLEFYCTNGMKDGPGIKVLHSSYDAVYKRSEPTPLLLFKVLEELKRPLRTIEVDIVTSIKPLYLHRRTREKIINCLFFILEISFNKFI
ncbi:uncharacterized protein LOC136030133 isoform X2 [Artemia franciscana]|uniref:uncharacterized protein LOC136030133 isoform X2 n=1 Tax=Artemia franciscana TaxID=6661 RepID=UPI0032D9C30D